MPVRLHFLHSMMLGIVAGMLIRAKSAFSLFCDADGRYAIFSPVSDIEKMLLTNYFEPYSMATDG